MAKGRMLQKRISNSRKLASLSSDTSRLLYTWMLAHLDINGCFYADPVMVNNIVFTRLQKPVNELSTALDELEAVGLIKRYETDGELYLYYPDFSEKQPSLQASKEGKPVIPPPTLEQLRSNSAVGPEELHHNITIKEEKVREEKIIKAGAELDKPPVDNSPPEKTPFEETEKGQELTTPAFDEFSTGKNGNGKDEQTELNRVIEELRKKHYSADLEKAMVLFLRKYNPDKNTNYKALIHCFRSLQKKLNIVNDPDPIKSPYAYLDAAMVIENGKHNAADYAENAKKKEVGRNEAPQLLGGILQAVANKAGGQPP